MFVLECISKASHPSPCPFYVSSLTTATVLQPVVPRHFDKIGSQVIDNNVKILGHSMKLEVESVKSFALALDLRL